MKPDFILHIGANKTGSSAIQTFIRDNLELFQNAGFAIPNSNLELKGTSSGQQVFAFQKYVVTGDTVGLTAVFDELKAQAGDATILCSAENLSNPGREQAFTTIGSKYNVKVILYIRRQDDLISSSWQQWHSKRNADFNAWLVLALQSIGHWERTITAWEKVVGEENVTVRVFERDTFPDGNILLDFLDRVGIDHRTVEPSFPTGLVNPSFSDVITGLVAGNSSLFESRDDNEFYEMILELTGSTYIEKQKYSLLSPDQRDSIVSFYAAQNERIRQKYFPERTSLFSPVDHKKYRYLSDEEVALEQRQIMMHLIFELWRQLREARK